MKYREAHSADPARDLRPEISELEKRISKMMVMPSELENPAPEPYAKLTNWNRLEMPNYPK